MIVIPQVVAAAMLAHAAGEAPIEACGLLLGKGEQVHRCYRMTNTDHSPEHFSMDPREQFDAARAARARGETVVAVYHSHPATPARMSAEDIRLAQAPGMRYVILSLRDPAQPVIRCYILAADQPEEEPVRIEEQEDE